jgi:hypothetical protein
MRRGRRGEKSRCEQAKRPSDSSTIRLLGPRLIIAAWLVFVLAMYFRLQIERALELAGATR